MASIKQEKTFESYIKSGLRKPLGQCMQEGGYSKASSTQPGHILRESKGWDELCEEYMPDVDLLKLHKQQLNSYKYIVVNGKKVKVEDNKSRLRALDMAYKNKGKYAATEIELSKGKYKGMSNEELNDLEKKLKKVLFKK